MVQLRETGADFDMRAGQLVVSATIADFPELRYRTNGLSASNCVGPSGEYGIDATQLP